jgi:anti-sigma factor RsiW
MNAKMQAQVAEFASAMKDANREAAVKVGMGEIYDAAMKEYRQAKTLQEASDVLKKWAPRVAIRALQGLTVGAGAAAGYNLYEQLKR